MPKVMLVDDDRTTAMLLETLLSLDGFQVVLAARGSDVLEKAHQERPDAFLIDYHLSGGVQGTEIVGKLRAEPAFKHAPIIMTSGMNVEEAALRAGANLFLIKPFDPAELPSLLNRLLSAV
ncbi:MAG: response regulator [Anaerolineae bacterium]|nr:response regulator [Anaerolineae bacterium]MDW8298839.1 response regulator [Anaerolineae bacterium]